MTQTFIGDVDLTANPEAARSSWEVADRDALTAAATDPRAVTLGEQPHPAGPVRRHGLTARSDLPDTLRLRTHEFRRDLQQEFQPVGFVENQLVEELARHLAGMELAGNSEERVLRHCGRERRDLDALLNPGGRLDDDACVTAAVASQPLERLARYRRQHERGFCAALTRLQAQQATRKEAAVRDQFARFRDEKTCADYLRKRVRGTLEECPRCGGRSGYWLSTGRWECRDCGRQVGLRSGSVMEGSRLPLSTWFSAVGEILANPAIRPEKLRQALGLPRLGTVRKVLRRILAAIRSPEVDRLLVGLAPLGKKPGWPEHRDPPGGDLQNDLNHADGGFC